jgi:hypothetical protein
VTNGEERPQPPLKIEVIMITPDIAIVVIASFPTKESEGLW